jgi:hypothetical protein
MSTRLYTTSADNVLQTFESIVASDGNYYAVVLNDLNETMFKPIDITLQSINNVSGTGPTQLADVPKTLHDLHTANIPMFIILKLNSQTPLTTIATTADSTLAFITQTPTDYLPIGDVSFGAERLQITNQVLVFAHKSICCTTINTFVTVSTGGTVAKTFKFVDMKAASPNVAELYTPAGSYFRPASTAIAHPVAILKACCIFHPGQAMLWYFDNAVADRKGTVLQTGFITTKTGPIYINNTSFLETKNSFRGAVEFIPTPMKALEHMMKLSLDPDMSYRDALWKQMVVDKSFGNPTEKGAIYINSICSGSISVPKYDFVCNAPAALSPTSALQTSTSTSSLNKTLNKTQFRSLLQPSIYYLIGIIFLIIIAGIVYCCKAQFKVRK